MSFNKSIFAQFGKELKREVKKYDAKEEKTQIGFKRCPHRNIKVKDGEAKCLACGAGWRGPRLADLLNLLRRNDGRRKTNIKRSA